MKYIIAFLLGVLALKAEIEFAGFFLTSEKSLFVLNDVARGQSSGWLALGDSFGRHTLVSFDRETEVLTVKTAEGQRLLPLRQAKIKEGKRTVTGTITLYHSQVDDVLASLFIGEESAFPLQEGVTLRIKPEARPDGSILYQSWFDVRGADGSEETIPSPAVVARPGGSFGVRMGALGFTFKP